MSIVLDSEAPPVCTQCGGRGGTVWGKDWAICACCAGQGRTWLATGLAKTPTCVVGTYVDTRGTKPMSTD